MTSHHLQTITPGRQEYGDVGGTSRRGKARGPGATRDRLHAFHLIRPDQPIGRVTPGTLGSHGRPMPEWFTFLRSTHLVPAGRGMR